MLVVLPALGDHIILQESMTKSRSIELIDRHNTQDRERLLSGIYKCIYVDVLNKNY